MDDIISYAAEADVFSESAFASSLAKAVFENIDAVDAVIDKYSIGWKKIKTSQNNSRYTSSCHMRDDVCRLYPRERIHKRGR